MGSRRPPQTFSGMIVVFYRKYVVNCSSEKAEHSLAQV